MARTPPAGTLPPVVSNVRFANSLLGFLIESALVGPPRRADAGCLVLSWNHSKSTPCLLVRHKYRHTNHHAAASMSFKYVPAPLGVAHDTNATRPTARTTAPPCPSHTRRTRGTGRAGAYEADFIFRVVVVASSSVRPVGCSGITRNTATPKTKRASPQHDQRRSKKFGVGAFWNVLGGLFFIAMRPLAGPVGASIFFVRGVLVRPSARPLTPTPRLEKTAQ